MSWRDQLRKARLGDAAFLVESAEAQIGRNTQVHEYPLRDKPFVEDLGRRARRFSLEAYVIGPQYMAARDALIAELESPGSKTLVHPYLGELKVSVVDVTGPRESTSEGGMARFLITFIESGERIFPAATKDTSRTVAEKAEAASLASAAAFTADFSTLQMPAFVRTSATSLVQGLADRLRSLVRTVTTVPSSVTGFIAALSDLSSAASQLILVPQTLASTVLSIFEQLEEIVEGPPAALALVRSMFDFGDDLPPVPVTGTSNRAREAANQVAFVGLVQRAAAVSAARFSSLINFEEAAQLTAALGVRLSIASPVTLTSADQVLALRDELAEVLDAQAEAATTDALYYAIVDVRTAMVVDLQTRGARLARIVGVTLPESTAAIALAYELYESTAAESDVIARNAVRDPIFLPSGRRLEVLSDA